MERETSISWEVPNFEDQLTEALQAQNADKPVLVLFDSADQAYKNEEIPVTIGALNRASFIKRKAMQLFPSHPIRAALEMKPAGKNRRRRPSENIPYLFAALPEAERLDRIGKSLLESGVLLSGFCLLPVESSSLVAELSKKIFRNEQKPSRWAAIIGQHETGARRQIFIKDGNLAFTRLTPASEGGASGAAWAEDVLRGLNETLAYISRIGYNINDGLDLIVISGELEKQFFDPKALRVTNFRCLTLGEALRAIGARSSGLGKSNYADALHAAWAAKKRILKLPVRVPSIHRIMAPRLAARVASVAFLLAALGGLWFAFGDYQGYRATQEEIAQRENQKAMLDREYEQESKVFDALPVKPATVKGVLAVKEQLETNTVPVAPTLHMLKRALGSDIFLESLTYEHSPSAALPLEGGAGQANAFAPPPAPDDRGNISIGFKFGLPSTMKLEQKVMRAEALEKTLKELFPKYSVRIVTQFGRVDRQGSLQGSLGAAGGGQAAPEDDLAEFELKGPPL
jgi:hypothetical protein